VRFAENVQRNREIINATTFISEDFKGRDGLADLGMARRIILKWMLKKYGAGL
jgi:hypothetical protein